MEIESEKQKIIYQINYIKENGLDKKVKSIIEEITNNYPDVYLKVRIKEEKSAINKLDIKKYQYANQISDLLGVMIVTKDIDEVYKIKADLEKLIPNINVEDYIKKPKFGYKSVHLNCRIAKDIPLEIQIKTEKMKIAQEMVHDSIYKNRNLNEKTKNMLSTIAYINIENSIEMDYRRL